MGISTSQGNRNFVSRRIREKLKLPDWRQFTDMEQIIIQDALFSPLSLDAITLFSCRPPELRFVKTPVHYFKYFTRIKHRPPNRTDGRSTSETLLHYELKKCGWVDGLDCQILVKSQAIEFILTLPSCSNEIRDLFCLINHAANQNKRNSIPIIETSIQLKEIKKRFVDLKYDSSQELPFPLFNVVKPTQANRFLIHLLLSMGSFDNEGQLYQGNCMKHFFFNAGLIPNRTSASEIEVIAITKKFVMEQLLFVPGGTMMFDRYCLAAYEAIRDALLFDSIASNDVPSYLYTTLVEKANDTALEFYEDMKLSLANSLCMLPNVPTSSELIKSSKDQPMTWKPDVAQLSGQHAISFAESLSICKYTTASIDVYVAAPLHITKSILICGGPGTGKTFQMRLACTYAMSKGLTTTITAVMAERALFLGGRHIHYLFCIPGENTRNMNKQIDQSIRGLNQNPERIQFLRMLDILFIDEMGYVSAELLNVMDTVMRHIRGKSAFMGGVLLIATIDDQQLPPVKAKPALVSSLVFTSFQMLGVKHSVRARNDDTLQTLINISREHEPSEKNVEQFIDIIMNKCVHVQNWNDPKIIRGTIRVLGTKKALQKAEEEYYNNIKEEGLIILSKEAETTQASIGSHGNWKLADEKNCIALNRHINEVQTLKLHQNIMVEMTYNRTNVWSHSQVAIVIDLPTQASLNSWKPINVILAPVGTNKLPEGDISKHNLLRNGWKEVKVGTAPEKEVRLHGRISAKRKQYAIKPRIAMTVHKALGGDFGSVVTSVCSSDGETGYKLWQKEQVEVLISRTPSTKDLIFVGNPKATAEHLVELLFRVSPFSSYMRHIVNQMTGEHGNNCNIRPLRHLPYNVRNTIIPTDSNGFVYLLLSFKDHNTTYIGQTKNLTKRIREHNSGIGSLVTANPSLRPWHIIAFITGFGLSEKQERLAMEQLWQSRRNWAGKSSLNSLEILHIGRRLVEEKNEEWNNSAKLKFVQCIEFKHYDI
jgi:predicted GIY-YIG superfamily endonuclease